MILFVLVGFRVDKHSVCEYVQGNVGVILTLVFGLWYDGMLI